LLIVPSPVEWPTDTFADVIPLKGGAANMLTSKFRMGTGVVVMLAALGATRADEVRGTGKEKPEQSGASKVLTEQFSQTHKLIRPQPGESRWMDIPWQTSLWHARQKAAEEGKPMFVWSGSGGAPCAPT
jgi:hypothetical protein